MRVLKAFLMRFLECLPGVFTTPSQGVARLKYKHICAYGVRAIDPRSIKEDTLLIDLADAGVRAFLTRNMDPYLQVVDRHFALASLMLRGALGGPEDGTFKHLLEDEIGIIQNSRRKRSQGATILVIEVVGQTEGVLTEPMKDLGDFAVCFDAFDKGSVLERDEDAFSSIVTSLCLEIPALSKIERLQDGVFLIDSQERIIHSFHPSVGSPDLVVSQPLRTETVETAARFASTLALKTDLQRVARLLAQSLDPQADRLKAFISSWSALEVFTNKVFREYEARFISDMRACCPSTAQTTFLDRISEVLKDKYTLSDKFNVISHFLGPDSSEQDVQCFNWTKKVRDRLLHGENIGEETLPLGEAQSLLMKYLKGYVVSKSD